MNGRVVTEIGKANVKESEKAYTMELAAPGIKKEYCRVGINDEGLLTIAIENKVEHKNEDKHHHYLRREFSYSNYEQNYTLPDDVERDKISAKVEDGILTVTMPKTEPKPFFMCRKLLKRFLFVSFEQFSPFIFAEMDTFYYFCSRFQ